MKTRLLLPLLLLYQYVLTQCNVQVNAPITSLNSGESVTLTATGADQFSWNPSNTLDAPTGAIVIASPVVTTTYEVTGVCDWISLDGGFLHQLAIKSDGTLWAWGSGNSGQLGTGDLESHSAPIQIGTDNDWMMVAAGNYFSLAIKNNGTLWAWGENLHGQLGLVNDFYFLTPTQVGSDTDWVDAAGAAHHSLFLKENGELWAAGDNTYGQIGIASQEPGAALVQVNTINDCVKMDAQGFHNLALRSNGSLWVWGDNNYGQLGIVGGLQNAPIQMDSTLDWMNFSAGYYHNLALKNDHTLWSWGNNVSGQTGTGSSDNFLFAPTQIGDQSDWNDISAHFSHSLAIKGNNDLWAWGRNQEGQLNYNILDFHYQPLFIANGYTGIYAGNECSFAFNNNQILHAWGSNTSGQLGIGNVSETSTPQPVVGSFGTAEITIDITTAIAETDDLLNIQIYPNPTTDLLMVHVPKQLLPATYRVLDATGKVCLHDSINQTLLNIELVHLQSGIYSFEVNGNREKFIIQR